MGIPEHVFREYDVRGLVGTELTPEFAEALGRGYGELLAEHGARSIALGHDHRTSGVPLAEAFSRGVRAHGIDVLRLGTVPTPLTYFAAHTLPVDGACSITGSHNPPEYNGFKLGLGKLTFSGEELQALKARVISARAPRAVAAGAERTFDVVTPYLHTVTQLLGASPRPLKVVVDAGNGTAGLLGPRLLRALGHEVIELFCELDGSFPNHHPDPTVEENLRDLQAAVRAHGAHLGLAWDGDADRLGAVDEQGAILWGDQLLLLFARDVLATAPGATVVGEVKCSQTVFDDIERRGGRAIIWKAGHSPIKAKMRDEGALFGGEMSGHLFFRQRWYGFDDGLYAAARLLDLAARDPRPSSQLLADVPRTYSSPEIRFAFAEEKKFRAVELARERLRAHGRTLEVDGVRVALRGGWGLVRASNTQPLLVLRWEAESPERLAEIAALIRGTVEQIRRELGG